MIGEEEIQYEECPKTVVQDSRYGNNNYEEIVLGPFL